MTDDLPTKALIYYRVSSKGQKDEGHGLESQETRLWRDDQGESTYCLIQIVTRHALPPVCGTQGYEVREPVETRGSDRGALKITDIGRDGRASPTAKKLQRSPCMPPLEEFDNLKVDFYQLARNYRAKSTEARMIPEFFKFRKKKFLKQFDPKLHIKKANRIRLPGDYGGEIRNGYAKYRHKRGYRDLRDYVTDLALHGLEKIAVDTEDRRRFYEVHRILDVRDRCINRRDVMKIDMNCFDWRVIEDIAYSLHDVDVYDCISYLIMIGEEEINGGIIFCRGSSHVKLYS